MYDDNASQVTIPRDKNLHTFAQELIARKILHKQQHSALASLQTPVQADRLFNQKRRSRMPFESYNPLKLSPIAINEQNGTEI